MKARWKKCKMLVKLNKKKQVVGIMTAINPDGTTTKAPRGWTWMEARTREYSTY